MLLTYLALIALLLSSFSEAFRKYSAARRTATLSATLRTGPVFCLNVNLYIQNDRRAEFIEVIKKNQQGTLSCEPLAKEYVWGESTTERNTFYFQEQYFGKEGFDFHIKTPHFADWEKFAATNPFSKPPEIFFFEAML